MTDKHWYPLYEKMVELEVPAMIHVSGSCNPNFHGTGAHYLNGDLSVFMQCIQEPQIFKDFPSLKFVIPHGGGAVPYHWGRYRGIALQMGRPELTELLMDNIYFDTCVYHQPGIQTLFDSVPVENIIFASEMIGAVRIKDPKTDTYFDDTKLYIDKLDLSDADRRLVFEGNARRVYPRLNRLLESRT
jgi:4-oxalmesaconate hydratase